jgi:hypothetical protein
MVGQYLPQNAKIYLLLQCVKRQIFLTSKQGLSSSIMTGGKLDHVRELGIDHGKEIRELTQLARLDFAWSIVQ